MAAVADDRSGPGACTGPAPAPSGCRWPTAEV